MTDRILSMTVLALNNLLKNMLLRAGADNPDGDAADIINAVFGYTRAVMLTHAHDEAEPTCADRAVAMAQKRADGTPIQYVIGSWSFMGRDYTVGEGVLIPRDDTEVLTRAALSIARGMTTPVIIDLCSGSGIIAVTIAMELSGATVYAVEKSEAAFCYLRRNADKHRAPLRLIHADLQDCVSNFEDGTLDMIVSNPPYIRTDELPTLQREVQYEPVMALDGGESGYDFYDSIVALWTPKLREGGCLAFEIGEGQLSYITSLLSEHGYTDIQSYPDIQGIPRAVTARQTHG